MGEGKGGRERRPIEVENQTSVVSMIITGQYQIVYDGKGLVTWKTASGTSTGYKFNVIAQGKIIGEYHIHPNRNRRFPWASGNFRLFVDNSFGSALIGRATDWQWLCDHVSDQI
jgi:hypothetical protein